MQRDESPHQSYVLGHSRSSRPSPKSRRDSANLVKASPKSKRPRYPPPGYKLSSIVSREEAIDLLAHGALEFQGKAVRLPFTQNKAHRLYADIFLGIGSDRIADDKASNHEYAINDSSMTFGTPQEGWEPDKSLEYPNMLYVQGRSPGTTTLNWFVGQRGDLRTPLDFKDGRIRKRKMKLMNILERLAVLEEEGLSESLEDQYHSLYDMLLQDPDQNYNPHFDTSVQIIDLMNVLMNREWIDFSIPKNQVVAKFFDSPEDKVKTKFFHQLLLAAELHLRIQSPTHKQSAKRSLLEKMPPKVLWDLALAERWLEHMMTEQIKLNDEEYQFNFKLQSKRRQIKALKDFARQMKWPNLEEVEYALAESDARDSDIEDRSADTMAWFSAVILPGPTLPFLIMNSLIDCDDDTEGKLSYLTHVKPNCGFQYRANTYWSYKCIMGKVLGASRSVKQVGGWIGPCHYAPTLDRTQCVLVRTKQSPAEKIARLNRIDVDDMHLRSDPLGDMSNSNVDEDDDVCLADFEIPTPPNPFAPDADVVIRIQKLRLKPIEEDFARSQSRNSRGAAIYDATVVFAIHGATVPMKLRYDVEFVYAPACANGPHALWKGYKTRTVRVEDGLPVLKGWGKAARRGSKSLASKDQSMMVVRRAVGDLEVTDDSLDDRSDKDSYKNGSTKGGRERSLWHRIALPTAPEPPVRGTPTNSSFTYVDRMDGYRQSSSKNLLFSDEVSPFLNISAAEQKDTTLLIDATGVSDNEVFARAWCANWGANAIIVNLGETCIACAVREARAAAIEVVIMTEGGSDAEEDQGVWDLVSVAS